MKTLGTLVGTKWEQVGTSKCIHVPSLFPPWEQMKSGCIPCVVRAVAISLKSLFPVVPSNVPSREGARGYGFIGGWRKRSLLFPLFPVFFAPPPPRRQSITEAVAEICHAKNAIDNKLIQAQMKKESK